MKKIAIAFVMISSSLMAQDFKYNTGAAFIGGMFIKYDGYIELKDSALTLGAKTGEKSVYRLISSVNNITYFTDGVMTNYFTTSKESGKKKGFEYDKLLIMNYDQKAGGAQVMYYCK